MDILPANLPVPIKTEQTNILYLFRNMCRLTCLLKNSVPRPFLYRICKIWSYNCSGACTGEGGEKFFSGKIREKNKNNIQKGGNAPEKMNKSLKKKKEKLKMNTILMDGGVGGGGLGRPKPFARLYCS